LKPLDERILDEVAKSGTPVITVEDGTLEGGMGSAVADWLADHGYSLPVTRLGIPDRFIAQGTPRQLKAMCGFDADGIYRTIVSLTQKRHEDCYSGSR
ncbi:MAG: hypothetical protein K2M02_04140, partial [Duncaniella sp.]|nr:hypothetical protein [Duncaniella sp.]